MRRLLVMTALGLAAIALLWSCSKKAAAPPTAPAAVPACELSTTTLSFGTVSVGATADRSFTLSNSGGGTLSGTVTASAAEFALIGPTTYSLGGGQSQGFTLRFSPASAGAKACTLSTGASCSRVVATGTGQSATPVCSVQTTLLDFGSVNYSSPALQTIAIQNAGGGTLTGSLSGAGVDFHFLDSPSFSLGAGQGASITLAFIPSSGGAQACTLQVSPGGCAPIVCRGTGTLPIGGDCAVTRVAGPPLDFGQVSVGSSADLPFTLKNFDTTYSADGAVVEVCPDFEVVGSALFGLAPGGTQVRYARFAPTRPGPQTCAMQVSCTMEGAGTHGGIEDYVICTGVGVGGTPTCQVSTTDLLVGTLHSGQVKDTTFTLTNAGSGTMTGAIRFIDAVPAPFSFVGSTTYSLGAGQSQVFTVRYTAPSVAPGHTVSDARQIDLGAPCEGLGYLTVQGTAMP